MEEEKTLTLPSIPNSGLISGILKSDIVVSRSNTPAAIMNTEIIVPVAIHMTNIRAMQMSRKTNIERVTRLNTRIVTIRGSSPPSILDSCVGGANKMAKIWPTIFKVCRLGVIQLSIPLTAVCEAFRICRKEEEQF